MDRNLYGLEEAWRMAIQKEQDAHDHYLRLAQMTTNAATRALFEQLAEQETGHKRALETEFSRYFERDLDAKDWATILWWDWEDEAFHLAQELDVPILLYITAPWCHWCHVMEEQSFTDPNVIQLVNAEFIPLKVDSDRRPDVNRCYNQGGWPTTAFLTPDGELLTGATYLDAGQLKDILERVSVYYHSRKGDISIKRERAGARLAAQETKPTATAPITEAILENVTAALQQSFDPLYGGFGEATKFHHTDALELLLAQYYRTGSEQAKNILAATLQAMISGGVHDRAGGGFFRCATHRDWSAPQTEKVLFENAALLRAFLHAYQLLGEQPYLETARSVIGYISGTLYDAPEGYFYGSQDADEAYYALSAEERQGKPAPYVDKTAFTDWGAQAVSAFLEAAAVLKEPRYAKDALRALDFLWQKSYDPDQGMFHYWSKGQAHLPGMLADQVYVVRALLDAFEHTGQRTYLERAVELIQIVNRDHLDARTGAYLDKRADTEAFGRLQDRQTPFIENSIAAHTLIRLARLTGSDAYRARAQAILGLYAADYHAYGLFAAAYALAVCCYLHDPLTIVVVGSAEDERTLELLHEGRRLFDLNRWLQVIDPVWEPERLAQLGYPAEPAPTAYLCIGRVCAEPTNDPSKLAEVVAGLRQP
ncbi:MAG: DUF255 domain-containing protein [Chloroflexota bacterium]